MEKHYVRQVHLFNMGYVLHLGKSQWALKKKIKTLCVLFHYNNPFLLESSYECIKLKFQTFTF